MSGSSVRWKVRLTQLLLTVLRDKGGQHSVVGARALGDAHR